MFRSKLKFAFIFAVMFMIAAPLTGCKEEPPPLPKIDLQQVDEAFRTTTGATFASWMNNFEWEVNQIYIGKEFVSVNARRYGRLLVINGYIERNKRVGYQLSDELIFKIKQRKGTFKFSYRVEDHIGWAPAGLVRTYNSAPTFPVYASVILISTWRPYYTPRRRIVVLRKRRRKYRKSKKFKKRKARAKKFRSKAKKASKKRSKARRSKRRRGGKR